MSLSLKAELETWAAALKAYDEQDFEMALDLFSNIADSSKILTNMGLIYATIGEHETAVEHFVAATNLDSYLSIAYFQCGVSNFLLERYDLALVNFEDACLYLRGNESINYDQIGLKFKLFSAEILFNRGLARINLGYMEQGLADMLEASKQKVTEEHNVIDEAIRDRGEGYTVFSIPVGVLYRPSENKLKNSKTKDYLGKAKLVAATDADDAFTEFTGVKRRQMVTEQILDINEAQNKPDSQPSPPSRDATAPVPPAKPAAAQPIPFERSKATLPPGVGVRPDPATILASRRAQSVSNPANVPPRPSASNLSRSNSGLASSNSTSRLPRGATTNGGGMAPLAVRTPQGIVAGAAGIGAGGPGVDGDMGPAMSAVQTPLQSQSSVRRLQVQGIPQPASRSAALAPPQSLQPGQYMTPPQGKPLVLPATLVSTQEPGHLTQFYDSFMDVYTGEPASQGAIPPLPTPQALNTFPSQTKSPITQTPVYQPTQSLPPPMQQEPEQPAAWLQSSSSSTRTSTNTSSSSALSRASSRAANAAMGMNQNMATMGAVKVGSGTIGGGSMRRKVKRRPTERRVTVYDEEGDDGFMTGEYEEYQMANIRVKLHYQGDVRGMTIPPTTTFDDFVARVTTKFGTSMTGLGMKFTDEEGTKISLRDESDFELAIETAREGAKGRSEGKMDVCCVDV